MSNRRNCSICLTSGHNRTRCPLMHRNFHSYITDEMLVEGNQIIENINEEITWEINRTPSEPVLQIEEGQIEEGQIEEGQIEEGQIEEGQIEEGQIEERQLRIMLTEQELLILEILLEEDIIPCKKPDIRISLLNKEEFECSICYENTNNNYCKLNCNHYFCNNCVKMQLEKQTTCIPVCALCREEITNIYTNDDNFII